MTKAQPYTAADLERGEAIVRELHGLKGFEAWAEHIAKEISRTRGADTRRQAIEEYVAAVECEDEASAAPTRAEFEALTLAGVVDTARASIRATKQNMPGKGQRENP